MNLEQLQAMSDDELNELAAVKVMGWNCIKRDGVDFVRYYDGKDEYTGYRSDRWLPTNDMNDAMTLFEAMVQDARYSDAAITFPWYVVAGWNPMSDEGGWEIQVDDEKLPRAITIASILAKGSE